MAKGRKSRSYNGLCIVALTLLIALTAILSESLAAPSATTTAPVVHKVVRGDTLYGLALKYRTTVSAIAGASGIDPDDILRIGMNLKIPARVVKASSQAPEAPTAAAEPKPEPLPARGAGRGAEAVPWAEVEKIYPRAAKATVTDVRTGRQFVLYRRAGWAHADVEPATRNDTSVVNKLWGTWSWSRRPVVIEVAGRTIAASMAGMPHGGEDIGNNGVLGHFDLHFLNSTTHGSVYTVNRRPTLDPEHQAMVREATGK